MAAEKLISIEIIENMLSDATLFLPGVARVLPVLEVVDATLSACSVIF